MSDGAPALEVGFEIDTAGSFASIEQLETGMDRATAAIVADAEKVERATGGMISLGKATAEVTSFGSAATREMREIAREAQQAERAGEGMLRQIARQNEAYGLSRSELRQLRVEERALAAERTGNSDLARRLREAEAELWGKEAYAARQASIARQNAAEDAAEAETRAQAQVIRQLRERAQLEEAIRRNTGVGQVRATDAGAGYSALAVMAAEDEARAKDMAAAANRRLANEHEQLANAVRSSFAAQEANTAAAERMRASTDPLYAATARLNAEIAESTRLYHAGATAPAEYARQQEYLQNQLKQTTAAQYAASTASGKNGFALTQLSFQINDVATMAAMGAPPLQIFASQAGQVIQVFQVAEGGASGFAKQLGFLTVKFAPLIAIAAGAAYMLNQYSSAINDAADTDGFIKSLNLTEKELKRVGDASVSMGDTLLGTWDVVADGLWKTIGPAVDDTSKSFEEWFWESDKRGRESTNNLIANFVGGYNAITGVWSKLPDAMSDLFIQSVNYAITSINDLVEAAVKSLNGFTAQANTLLPDFMAFGQITAPQIALLENTHAGAAKNVAAIWRDEMESAQKDYMGMLGASITDAAIERRNARVVKALGERDKAKDTKDTAGEKRAEQLAREAEAVEAQIRNLHLLADAYRVSGAEALIAEAKVKAESNAIKKRAEISEMVERQIRLAIAGRVADAAKSTAAMREQLEAQRAVNAMVEAGLVPADRASELISEQIEDLPLLAALQVAQQRGYTDAIERATQALQDQRKMRAASREEEARSQFNAAMEVGRGRLAELREEGRLIRANDSDRIVGLAKFRAEQEATEKGWTGQYAAKYVAQQVEIAEEQIRLTQQQNALNQELSFTADLFSTIDENARFAAQGMSEAFGSVGAALGGLLTITTGYHAADQRMRDEKAAYIAAAGNDEQAIIRANQLFALRSTALQVGAFGDMAAAAKGFFKEGTSGYRALAVAEKAFRAVEFALSVRAMAQDAIETAQKLASGGARIAVGATEAVVNAIKSLPFPLNIAAGAATIGALASIGVAVAGAFGGSGKNSIAPANEGKGTVFGDADAKSESIKRSIDSLREVDLLTANYSRDMLNSLRSIDNQIGGFASLVLRTGGINADLGIREGFQTDGTGKLLSGLITGGGLFSKIPLVGGLIGGLGSLVGSLFGSKTSVVGSGLYGGPQSLESIMGTGFDASYYSDIKKTKKFFGISTGSSYSTQYAGADPALENQFTLVLRSFYEAVSDAAGPLGVATSDIQRRLNGFVVDIGKIDTRELTGSQLQEKLTAVFGAAADRMASAAFPGMERFQKAGEGMFETLVRVASTVESVTGLFTQLGRNVAGISIDAQLALVDQFGSLNDLSSATQSYFETFYTREEQAKARLAQFTSAFAHMGITLPNTLAGFRKLVEAQDLTTAAGREVYATLLQVAPAFADLQSALNGARSAADILSERQDLQRKLLEVKGDTAALRELDLARLDVSNRALQKQIWAIQDAQEAAKAADELRKAWTGVGDSLLDEVKRIRGLTNGSQGGNFAQLMGQFNAASASARGGDIEAAKLLPGLSQSLLTAAELAATSRQELDRVRAQVAANLEATHGATLGLGTAPKTTEQVLESLGKTVAAAAQPANDSLIAEFQTMKNDLRTALDHLRTDNNKGHAATAANTSAMKRKLDDVTANAGGTAIAMVAA